MTLQTRGLRPKANAVWDESSKSRFSLSGKIVYRNLELTKSALKNRKLSNFVKKSRVLPGIPPISLTIFLRFITIMKIYSQDKTAELAESEIDQEK